MFDDVSKETREATTKAYLEQHAERVNKFIRTYKCRLVDHTDITSEILKVMNGRGEDWPWVEQWARQEAPGWVNDLRTIVFEIPLTSLDGRNCLHFTREVWSFQPSVFAYQTWGDRTFVRIHWDEHSKLYRLLRSMELL